MGRPRFAATRRLQVCLQPRPYVHPTDPLPAYGWPRDALRQLCPRQLTKRQREREERRIAELCEREARGKRHEQLLAEGYELVRANERHHPAHPAELVERIDALARYLGMGTYEPTASHKGKLKRARRLWRAAYSNFQAMIREPEWWRANARNQWPIVFPPDAAPLPATAPEPVYVKDGVATLPYEPFGPFESL
jgi:hypothetical protein